MRAPREQRANPLGNHSRSTTASGVAWVAS